MQHFMGVLLTFQLSAAQAQSIKWTTTCNMFHDVDLDVALIIESS